MRKKKWHWQMLVALSLIAAILGVCYYLLSTYSVTKVDVEGNIHYTKEEIEEIVMGGPLGYNSLYVSLKNKYGEPIKLPFVDVIEVTVPEADHVKITVYEKALSGYVEFMDSYMYFDRDGYAVECSNVKTVGVPQITGLKFDHMVLGEKIPVEDAQVFERIWSITKLIPDTGLVVDKIHFQTDSKIVLYFGNIKVAVGDGKNLEDKMMILPTYLEKLAGKKGTLHMEDYTEDSDRVTFKPE